MKIALFDHDRKFTKELISHWINDGNEVKIDRYWDPCLVSWADVSFFEFCDLSIQRASNPNDPFYKDLKYGAQPQKKKICVRSHDIDIHCGGLTVVNWQWITNLIFVNEHMRNIGIKDLNLPSNVNISTIKHGIDLNKFDFKKRTKGKKIVWIGGLDKDHKRIETALMVLAELPRDYSLHIMGRGLRSWRKDYVDYFIKQNNLNVVFDDVGWVSNVNDWLQDKDYLLSCSTKEAFGFVIAEACSMGIKPIIHNFPFANQVWNSEWIWNTVSEAVKMIQEDKYESLKYRQYVEEHYPLSKMLSAYDELLK